MTDKAANANRALRRLAEALEVPVESFYGSGATAQRAGQTETLLILWDALDGEQDRQKVLALLRRLVESRA